MPELPEVETYKRYIDSLGSLMEFQSPEALPVGYQPYDDQPGGGLPYIEESLGEP